MVKWWDNLKKKTGLGLDRKSPPVERAPSGGQAQPCDHAGAPAHHEEDDRAGLSRPRESPGVERDHSGCRPAHRPRAPYTARS